MEVVLRRANVGDAEVVQNLSLLCNPRYQESACAWAKAIDDTDSGRNHYVAEIKPSTGSERPIVVGYGRYALEHGTTQDCPKYRVYLGVHPESRRQGIGSALLEHMIGDLRRLGASGVRARVQSDHAEELSFLRRREFSEYNRKVNLELDLRTLDAATVERSIREHDERMAALDITIQSLADWSREEPCYLSRLLPVYNSLGNDVPQPEPYKPVTIGELRRFLSQPDLSPDGFFVAIRKDDVVGFSYLLEPRREHHVIVGMTGVLPEFRRLKIATAMKLKGIRRALSLGIPTMVTSASTQNVASIAVNKGLGFKCTWEEVRLERWLN